MNITLQGKEKLKKFTRIVDLEQVEGVKNFTIEILMDKVALKDVGTHKLSFKVSDMYSFTEFHFKIEIIDVTPAKLGPPLPELPPKFMSPLENIEVNYKVNETNPSVSYILPESLDYNFDPYTISFD